LYGNEERGPFFIGEKEQYSVETVANVFENVSLASFFS
jgi:hypothetical protein